MNFKDSIKNSPKQYKQGFTLSKNVQVNKFQRVIICGMGGSAFAPELLATFLRVQYTYNKPIVINHEYDLPVLNPAINQNDLIILNSYSGNTEETLSCAKQAIALQAQVIAVTTGGELTQMALEHKWPLITMPAGLQPRNANGYNFSGLLQLFITAKEVPQDAKKEVITATENFKPASFKEKAKQLAAKLKNKTTCFYADKDLLVIAMECKIKINENSKAPSFYAELPEANHHEINGFAQEKLSRKFTAVFLKHDSMHSQVIKRINATTKLYEQNGVTCEVINIPGNTWMKKATYALYLIDWTSYFLALKYKIDAEKVEMVEKLKKMIRI